METLGFTQSHGCGHFKVTLNQEICVTSAYTFSALILARRRSRFELTCAAAQGSNIIIIKKNRPYRESNLHAEPCSDLKSNALLVTTRPPRLFCILSKASYVFLAENALSSTKEKSWSCCLQKVCLLVDWHHVVFGGLCMAGANASDRKINTFTAVSFLVLSIIHEM